MFSVYIIRNTINDKVYIGYTGRKLNARLLAHITAAKNDPKFRFHNALNKYKPENFTISLLEGNIETAELARERETHWILVFDSSNKSKGYNATPGGTGGWMIGRLSESKQKEWLEKIKKAATGEKNPRFCGIPNDLFLEMLAKKCLELGCVMTYGQLSKRIREDDNVLNFPKSLSKYRGSSNEITEILIQKTGLPFKMYVRTD
jgi:group I intron endonuclease